MTNALRLGVFLAVIVGSGFALIIGAEWVSVQIPGTELPWYAIAFVVWIVIILGASTWGDVHWPLERRKPDGYVGKFRRPDGSIVHVTRFSGDLVVLSEEPVRTTPRELGIVSGRELLTWTKLTTIPDG